MRKTLLSLIAVVLAVGVLMAARYLDTTPVETEFEPLPTMRLEGYEPTLADPMESEEQSDQNPETTPVSEGASTSEETEPAATQTTESDASTAVTEAAGETEPAEETEPGETEPVETVPAYTGPGGESYVLTFAGDCTLGSNLNNAYNGYGFFKTVGEDMEYPFVNVAHFFENDDYTLVNLEGPLCLGGNPAVKNHVFRGNPEFVEILAGNGVEFASLANNHSQDYGNIGYAETKDNLTGADISYVERDSSTIVTTESGLTIGIYGAVYYMMDAEVIEKEISKLRRTGVDLVVFAPHWGSENSYVITDDQAYLAHVAIDAGADIVFGTHPHVLQPIEEYKDGIILYSLGNFCFGGNIYPKDFDTALIQLEIIREEDGSVTLGQTTIIPASISSRTDRNDYQPTLYEEGSEDYERVLQKLSGTFR